VDSGRGAAKYLMQSILFQKHIFARIKENKLVKNKVLGKRRKATSECRERIRIYKDSGLNQVNGCDGKGITGVTLLARPSFLASALILDWSIEMC
jgi:hypothetical protein